VASLMSCVGGDDDDDIFMLSLPQEAPMVNGATKPAEVGGGGAAEAATAGMLATALLSPLVPILPATKAASAPDDSRLCCTGFGVKDVMLCCSCSMRICLLRLS